MDTITLDSFFDSIEIETDYLRNLLEKVLSIINIPDLHFGKICEGRIFGNEGAVTWDGQIYLDSKKLQYLDEDVSMSIIAHEFAHYHLGHHTKTGNDFKNEEEADALARQWGFDIDKFRRLSNQARLYMGDKFFAELSGK